MRTITVKHPTGSYPIYLIKDGLAEIGAHLAKLGHHGRCAVVTNETVGRYHARTVLDSLTQAGFEAKQLNIPDGEQFKTLETVAQLYGQFVEAKLDRRSLVIALGGGVLGDTVGFAAASYLRGLPFVQIPTTLLAMVDASVGGKTGVDLPQGKNLVGAFKQPEMVMLDPNVLATLPVVEFRSGMAEVVKHGIIESPQLFAELESKSKEYAASSKVDSPAGYPILITTNLLQEAVMVKVRVVQVDPFEQGRRAVLNLGHTFAHAFERLANFEMRHGEAVAMGLVCAARLAQQLKLTDAVTVERIIKVLQRLKLPTQPPDFAPEEVWAAMFTDKKREGNTVRFILPRAIGEVDMFGNVTEADVLAVLGEA